MRVDVEQPRFAVEFRPRGTRKWSTIVTCGSAAEASRTMYDMMNTRSGDWAVRQLPSTCMDSADPEGLPSGTEPRGTRR